MTVTSWWNPAAESPDFLPSKFIANLTVRAVRRGGMGMVLLCESKDQGREAVKVLSAEMASRREARESFLREAFLWISLGEHPNIVHALWAANPQSESPMVGSEYIKDSLRDVSEREEISTEVLLTILTGIVHGLSYAHRQFDFFAHGDLKPENVMITDEGQAKVGDFGLAQGVGLALSRSSHSVTEPGASLATVAGTPLYMAPEQIRGELGPESDIYSFGCMTYELLTRALPYGEPFNESDYLLRHLVRAPNPIIPKHNIPPSLITLVYGCLEKDPQNRPSLAQMQDELKRIGDSLECRIPEEPAVKPQLPGLLRSAFGLAQTGFSEDSLKMLGTTVDFPDISASSAVDASLIRIRALMDLSRHNEALEEIAAAARLLYENEEHDFTGNLHMVASVSLLNSKGNILAATGDESDQSTAYELFQEACRIHPTSTGYANLALSARQLGRGDDAILAMQKAVSISRDVRYYQQLVIWLAEDGRHREAQEFAAKCLSIHENNPVAHALRSMAIILKVKDTSLIAVSDFDLLAHDLKVIGRVREDNDFLAEAADLIEAVIENRSH